MTGKKRKTTAQSSTRPTGSTRSSTRHKDVPKIYRDMLAEADIQPTATLEERPVKRRRHGLPHALRHDRLVEDTISSPEKPNAKELVALQARKQENEQDNEDVDDMKFDDVAPPPVTIQTIYRDSDEEEEEEEEELFEDVDFVAHAAATDSTQGTAQDLELDLSVHTKIKLAAALNRRKPLNNAEKDRRIKIHKTHLLCLLAHVARRNRWCNDPQVQDSLQSLLTPKMIAQLNPGGHLTQFAQALSLKEGLKLVNTMFSIKFRITERGMRKALWAETEEHLKDYSLPTDSEAPLDKSDFRKAAKSLSGSRDVGAQLYCALLRAAGVEARLVCSLQPLSFGSSGPYIASTQKKKQNMTIEERYRQQLEHADSLDISKDSSTSPSPRRRLGYSKAAALVVPEPTPSRQATPAPKKIIESSYPVYWVEVLDEAHQKWQPTDPLVTRTFWKPQKLEPPAGDRENCMGYVVSFEEDGTAKDVTRRYAKAYNAKTRKMRIESVLSNGERWWRQALQAYSRGYTRDLDQIEATEMAALEIREPMPSNIADFKDHPIYALERHLRQHEVLVPNASPSGTVGAGSKAPLERVYRREDVRVARSKEKWYRLGREVLPDEIPVKLITKPANLHEELFSEEAQAPREGETCGTPIFTMDQTELYKAPPVLNGKIPKNRYGNVDLYVPSMVPEGGVYIADDLGAQAAIISGVDYGRALTGFQFSGKKGTAVLRGVVVAAEYEEAVRTVIEGLRDQEVEMEKERKCRQVLRMWRLFLMNLRVRQRLWAGADDTPDNASDDEVGDQNDEVGGGDEFEMDHKDAGGFEIDDEHAGGFEIDEEYAGGFMLD
ncbi:Rad4-domain-containing protein [Xylaria nigripes]|nr:Rad4-domain-containing protein [Xylaria nigripes]